MSESVSSGFIGQSADLRTRIVLAVIDALKTGDKIITISVGRNELRIGWVND